MAITDAYATDTRYRQLISKQDLGDPAVILEELTLVSRILERRLGRFFTKDDSAVARTHYVGDDDCRLSVVGRTLRVPEIATKTGFALKRDEDEDGSFADETAWTLDTDFQLLPLNAEKGPEALPWSEIRIPPWSTKSLWAEGQYVQITSAAGWPAIPKAIERGTCHLTAILRLETQRAVRGVPQDPEQLLDGHAGAQQIVEQLINEYGRRVLVY